MRMMKSPVWVLCLFVATAANAGEVQPVPCPRPPVQCPGPMSLRTWVHNNLKPNGNSCIFEMRSVDRIKLWTGENVDWSFCNACDVDMTVQLDTPSPGPFGPTTFQFFLPLPMADNFVTQTVPCHGYASISGYGANEEGDWKYSMRSTPAGTVEFPDVIDPRLEIDDTPFMLLLQGLGLLVAGLIGGALIARRRKAQPSST